MKTLEKKSFLSRLLVSLALVSVLTVAYGCGKKDGAESAGEKMDEAVDEAKNGPSDLFDKDGKAENAGEKVDEALDGDK